MTIPEIRQRLLFLSKQHGIAELTILAHELRRRPPVRRAPRVSPTLTPPIATRIRRIAAAFPDWPYTRIAQSVGVNPGRVSEVLAGKRK